MKNICISTTKLIKIKMSKTLKEKIYTKEYESISLEDVNRLPEMVTKCQIVKDYEYAAYIKDCIKHFQNKLGCTSGVRWSA